MRKTKHNKGENRHCILLSDSIVLSLDVEDILHHESFGNVLGSYIAVKG